MSSRMSKSLQDRMKRDLAELRKRYLDRDTLLELAWIAGAQGGLEEARKIVGVQA